jgi:hypothetical protein
MQGPPQLRRQHRRRHVSTRDQHAVLGLAPPGVPLRHGRLGRLLMLRDVGMGAGEVIAPFFDGERLPALASAPGEQLPQLGSKLGDELVLDG